CDRDGRRVYWNCGCAKQQCDNRKSCCRPHCAVYIKLYCCGQGRISTIRFNVKVWETIADSSAKPVGVFGLGLSRGFRRRTIWIADAHRDDENVSLCERTKS